MQGSCQYYLYPFSIIASDYIKITTRQFLVIANNFAISQYKVAVNAAYPCLIESVSFLIACQ